MIVAVHSHSAPDALFSRELDCSVAVLKSVELTAPFASYIPRECATWWPRKLAIVVCLRDARRFKGDAISYSRRQFSLPLLCNIFTSYESVPFSTTKIIRTKCKLRIQKHCYLLFICIILYNFDRKKVSGMS